MNSFKCTVCKYIIIIKHEVYGQTFSAKHRSCFLYYFGNIFINVQMARFVHDVDDFGISDLGKPKVDIKRFHYDVTNKMKEDMKDAYDRLIGRKGTAYEFIYPSQQKTIVDGKKTSRPENNRDLCLRIDLQDTHIEEVAGKEMKVANVQIQLNKKERPSTIAQVHFQCGVDIPKDDIIQAFKRSWTDKKIIYVFLKEIK